MRVISAPKIAHHRLRATLVIASSVVDRVKRVRSMAHDAIGNSTLVRTVGDVLGNLSDLVQKEVRLARAEFTAKITNGVHAGLWMIVAALLGLVAFLLVIEALVFALASFGLALYWACLLVAAVLVGGPVSLTPIEEGNVQMLFSSRLQH